jgi:NAD(P)-dependent dehydrogenase (short-subunit alcohol dehydrogenase family)
MDLELRNKRALVAGGSRGIGKAIARGLALEGASVAILARDAERLAATAAELVNETGATVVAVVADTTDEVQVERAVAEAVAALGGGFSCCPTLRNSGGSSRSWRERWPRPTSLASAGRSPIRPRCSLRAQSCTRSEASAVRPTDRARRATCRLPTSGASIRRATARSAE